MIHPQAIHMVLSAGEKGAASLIGLLFVGVAHSLLAIAAGPAANPHGPSQGFDSPAAGLFTALSKSLSNSRSEEHTAGLQSLMSLSYPVYCLKTIIKAATNTHFKSLSESSQTTKITTPNSSTQ